MLVRAVFHFSLVLALATSSCANAQDAQVAIRPAPHTSSSSAYLPVEIIPQLTGDAPSVALSPDGNLVLTGGSDARLWDVASGRLLRSIRGHADRVSSVAFSPDGSLLLTGSLDTTARLWDAASGRPLRTYGGHSNHITSVAFSPDGDQVLTGSFDNTARLWDAASGRLLRRFEGHSNHITSVAFSPDGDQVLTGSFDNTARLWDATSGRLLHTFEGHSNYVTSVAFSPDGDQVLSGSRDRTAILWDIATRRLVGRFEGHSHWVTSVAFSPDGKRALTGGRDRSVRLWAVASRQLLRRYDRRSRLSSVTFSPDERQLLTGSSDGNAELWDATTGRLFRSFKGHSYSISSISFSANGSRLLSGSWDHTAKLWDTAGGRLLRTFEGHSDRVSSVAASHDGSRVLTGSMDSTAKLWDADSGRLLRSFEGDSGWVNSVALSPDGNSALTGHQQRSAKLWDATRGLLLRRFDSHFFAVTSVAFSPDAGQALTGGWNKALLWRVTSGTVLSSIVDDAFSISSVALSPDGSRVLTGTLYPFSAKLWDAADGRLLTDFQGHRGGVNSVAFSPDGSSVLTGSEDRTAKLWDAASGRLLQTFVGHSDEVSSVAFTPDGRQLVTGSLDTTLGYWDVETGERLASSMAFDDGGWLTITPEGFFDASASGAENLAVVRGLESYSIDQVYQALYRPDLVAAKLAGDPDGLVAAAAAKLDLEAVIESGAAPRVLIAGLTDGAVVETDSLVVEAAIADQGGGIGRIEWRVNGITLGVDTRGFDRLTGHVADNAASTSVAPVRVTQQLTLDPGENTIEVVAYNEKGLIASDPARVVVSWDGSAATTSPRLHVLAVGVNDYYDSRYRLTYARTDAVAIGAAFETAGEELYESVEVTTVLDAEVTASNLDAVFADLGTRIRPRDVFVLFMAGHGKTQDGRYYFLPHDFRYVNEDMAASGGIDQDQFQQWLAQIPARKTVLLFDTCESGSLTGGVTTRGLEEAAALDRMTRAMGRTVLSASTDDAPALEGYNGHGVFTYALLQALGDGDANADGTIEVTELAGAIDRLVPELSYAAFNLRQIPQMNIVGSDFPLASTTRVLSASLGDAPQSIPTTPTHVVIANADVHQEPDSNSPVITQLQPGTQVRVISEEGGRSQIARQGEALGYIQTNVLAAIQ